MNLNRLTQRLFRRDLIRFVFIPALLLLILGIVSMLIARYYVSQEISRNNLGTLSRSAEYVDLLLNELEALSLNYTGGTELRTTLKQILRHKEQSYSAWQALALIQSSMLAQSSTPYIQSIYLYYNNDLNRFISSTASNFSYTDRYYDQDWYAIYLQNTKTSTIWSALRTIRPYSYQEEKVLSLFMPLYSANGANSSGVAVINLRADFIEQSLQEMRSSQEQGLSVFNEKGEMVLSCGMPELSEASLEQLRSLPTGQTRSRLEGKTYVVTKLAAAKLGWCYLLLTPLATFNAIPRLVLILNLILVLALIIVSVPLMLELTRKSRNTLSSIIDILGAAEKDQMLPSATPNPDSYDYIIRNVLDTFIEHKVLRLQLDERRYQMQVLELQALQAQINPHFLFNTLHTINWKIIALTHGPNEASDMIESLSTILNYSLRDPMQIVTLEEEIECARCYLRIIEARFKSKVQVDWEIITPLPQCGVPKLILQPLIENAITHGLRSCGTTLKIHLHLQANGNRLQMRIEDTGRGIPEEKLRELKERIDKCEFPDSNHVGLLNIAKRLQLIFGQIPLQIESKENVGTCVQVEIPISEATAMP